MQGEFGDGGRKVLSGGHRSARGAGKPAESRVGGWVGRRHQLPARGGHAVRHPWAQACRRQCLSHTDCERHTPRSCPSRSREPPRLARKRFRRSTAPLTSKKTRNSGLQINYSGLALIFPCALGYLAGVAETFRTTINVRKSPFGRAYFSTFSVAPPSVFIAV